MNFEFTIPFKPLNQTGSRSPVNCLRVIEFGSRFQSIHGGVPHLKTFRHFPLKMKKALITSRKNSIHPKRQVSNALCNVLCPGRDNSLQPWRNLMTPSVIARPAPCSFNLQCKPVATPTKKRKPRSENSVQ